MANLNEQIKVDRSVSQVVRDGNGKLQSWYEMQMTFTVTRSPVTGRPVFVGGAGVGGRAQLVFIYNEATGALSETRGDYFGSFHGELVEEAVGRLGAGQITSGDIADFGDAVSQRLTAVNAAIASDLGGGAIGLLLGDGRAYSPVKLTPKGLTGRDIKRCHDIVAMNSSYGVVELAPGAKYVITAESVVPILIVPGSGYTSAPTVTIGPPNDPSGTQAVIEAVVADGGVRGFKIINPGLGYTTKPTITITGGGGTGAVVDIELVGLHWNTGRVGIVGNGATLSAQTMTRGYAVHWYGALSGTSVPLITVLPFSNFFLLGPGDSAPTYNALNIAQNNPTDGMLFGGGLGTSQSANMGTAPTGTFTMTLNQLHVSGFRDNYIFADRAYLLHFYGCYSGRAWRSSANVITGIDAGENIAFFGGCFYNNKTSKTGVLRIVAVNEGTGYTSAPTVTISPPASGVQATATAVVWAGKVVDIVITNEGSGYDKNNPPDVLITGGNGSGAKAVAVCHSVCIHMEPGGNADLFISGMSFDYSDQIWSVFSGGITATAPHCEDNSTLPMVYMCPGYRDGAADTLNMRIFGGGFGPTRGAVRPAIFRFDTARGSDKISFSCRSVIGVYDQPVARVYDIVGSARPAQIDFDGTGLSIGSQNQINTGQFNQAANADLLFGSAGQAPAGWEIGSATGLTITKEAGIGVADVRTAWIVRGNTPNTTDFTPETVSQVTEIRYGDKVYVAGTDFNLGGSGAWIHWGPAGDEPPAGALYRMTYLYGGAGVRIIASSAVTLDTSTTPAGYLVRNKVPIRPGQRPHADFYMFLSAITSGSIRVYMHYYDGAGNIVGSYAGSLPNRTTAMSSMTRVVASGMSAPPGAQAVGLVLQCSGFAGTIDLGRCYLYVQ